jgi:hypothetical protein
MRLTWSEEVAVEAMTATGVVDTAGGSSARRLPLIAMLIIKANNDLLIRIENGNSIFPFKPLVYKKRNSPTTSSWGEHTPERPARHRAKQEYHRETAKVKTYFYRRSNRYAGMLVIERLD